MSQFEPLRTDYRHVLGQQRVGSDESEPLPENCEPLVVREPAGRADVAAERDVRAEQEPDLAERGPGQFGPLVGAVLALGHRPVAGPPGGAQDPRPHPGRPQSAQPRHQAAQATDGPAEGVRVRQDRGGELELIFFLVTVVYKLFLIS